MGPLRSSTCSSTGGLGVCDLQESGLRTEAGLECWVLWCCVLPTQWHRVRVWGSIPCAVTAGAVLMVGSSPHHPLNTEGSSQKGKAASTGKAW